MKSDIGANPPLHRRFDEKMAMQYICNRYRTCREKIEKQVEVLQQDVSFRRKCQSFYEKGYKDWVILSGIMNCMLNWKAREMGLVLGPDVLPELMEKLHETRYPPNRFLEQDLDIQILVVHGLTALNTYGFEIRQRNLNPEMVEKFLRERMKHFSFDLPHERLFCEQLGDWPRT